jgi:hypothetical protein
MFSFGHILSQRGSHVGIVYRFGVVGAQVITLVSLLCEVGAEDLFEREAPMIATYDKSHDVLR